MNQITNALPELRDKVRRAFGSAVYPGDENLVTGSDPECFEIAAALRGREWSSVSPTLVRECAEALPLLTPAAFCYYLPAYLLACIDAREQIDVAWDSVIFNLTPSPARESWQRRFRIRTDGFTALQAEAITAVLELMEEREHADWETAGMKRAESSVAPALLYWKERMALPPQEPLPG